MKIKSFLPSKIMACMMCFMFYVAGVYLFVELKPEKFRCPFRLRKGTTTRLSLSRSNLIHLL